MICAILVLALSPEYDVKIIDFEINDKLKHIIAFFTLSFFFFKSFENISDKYKFFILSFFAIVLEIIQSFVGREASFADFIASFFGVVLYLLLSNVIKENTSNKNL